MEVHDLTKAGYYDNGQVQTGKRMGIGYNFDVSRRYAPDTLFIDWMQRNTDGSSLLGGATLDADGWIDANNGSGSYWYFQDPLWGPNFEMTLRWSGTGDCVLEPFNTLIYDGPNEPSPENRRVYNMDGVTNNSRRVVPTWGSGYPTDITLMKTSNVAAYDAGDRIDPLMLSDVAGCASLRFMQAQLIADQMIRDWSEYDQVYGRGKAGRGRFIMPEAIAAVCNAANCDAYICIPWMFTDEATTTFATRLFDNLDSHLNVYCEYGNEPWNWGGIFLKGNRWCDLIDAPLHDTNEVSVDPANGIITEIDHGLATGDELWCFDPVWFIEDKLAWPYNGAGIIYPIVDDNDTWRPCRFGYQNFFSEYADISGISKASTCIITATNGFTDGDPIRIDNCVGITDLNGTDYTVKNPTSALFELYDEAGTTPIDSQAFAGTYTGSGGCYQPDEVIRDGKVFVTSLRYKRRSDSSNPWPVNYANRSVELWAIFDGIFGRGRIKTLVNSHTKSTGNLSIMLEIDACRSRLDYVSLAPYFGWDKFSPEDWENNTTAELTAFAIDGDIPAKAAYTELNMQAAGHYRFISYEGGDAMSQEKLEKGDKFLEWTNSVDCAPAYEAYYRAMSSVGYEVFNQYRIYGHWAFDVADDATAWGLMDKPGDTGSEKYQVVKAMQDAGGAPKT